MEELSLADVTEIIGQSVFQYIDDENSEEHREINGAVGRFMDFAVDSYVLVQWPDSQLLMEEDWFEKEAILDTEGKFGSSAYFVPLRYLSDSKWFT